MYFMSQDPLHLLCIEPTFPGRLGSVADWLVRKRGYRCTFFFANAEPKEHWPQAVGQGLDLVHFNVGGVAKEPRVAWSRLLERGLCYAYGCWEVLEMRRPRPIDVVLGRSAGLGSALFAPIYVPGAPVVNFFDYFYHPHANDLAEEAGPETPVEYFHWRRAANAMDLIELESGFTPWTATEWQRDLYPREYRKDFLVLFDGVDTRRFKRRTQAPRTVAGREIPPGTRVISFVADRLDRLRGFDRFMELANRLVRARSDVLCIVIGGAPVQRGLDVQFYNQDYGAHVLAQTPPYDPERFWFLGSVPQNIVAELLAVSDLHVYPSRPYVVSRSLVEALSAGCVVLAADNAPVREFITADQTGLLVNANDADAWEKLAQATLDDPAAHQPLGAAAASMARERYGQDMTLPHLATLFDRLASGEKLVGSP
jgi:glycosyltransferase involved in cell wall biosynthesis